MRAPTLLSTNTVRIKTANRELEGKVSQLHSYFMS